MTRLLDGIEYPSDLRHLSVEELNQLAGEIRDEVISVVSEVGGHFASTLGAVELTLALHYVFNTPEDRIVWDTGHQAYAHKLLCGRRDRLGDDSSARRPERFSEPGGERVRRLRRGPCGHVDFRGARHGRGEDSRRGEAQSRRGDQRRRPERRTDLRRAQFRRPSGQAILIVVLNDNEHFIDPRVGAVSSFLSKQFTTDLGVRLQKNLSNLAQEPAEWRESQVSSAQNARLVFKFGNAGLSFREFGISIRRTDRRSQY